MSRHPRTPGEAPAREFELPYRAQPRPARDRPPVPGPGRSHLHPPGGIARREPSTGPDRDPELQGH